jgi:hypothetical protein
VIDDDIVPHLSDLVPGIDDVIDRKSGSKINFGRKTISVIFKMIIR